MNRLYVTSWSPVKTLLFKIHLCHDLSRRTVMTRNLCIAVIASVSLSAQDGHLSSVFISPDGPMLPGKPVPVKGAPYSAQATSEISWTLADGNRVTHRAISMLYRDSEGRERCEQSSAEFKGIVVISDPVENASYSLDVDNKIARRSIGQPWDIATDIHGARIRFVPGPEAPATLPKGSVALGPTMAEQLGSQTIEGILAIGTRETTTTPAGRIGNDQPITFVNERWISPDLHIALRMTDTNPRRGTFTYELTNIVRGEQPRSLFVVPAGYTVESVYGVRMAEVTRKQ
jgi:hypothetical protein